MDSLSIASSQVPYYQPQAAATAPVQPTAQVAQQPAFAGGAQAAAYTPQAAQVQEGGGLSLGKLLAGTAAVVGTVAAVKTHHANSIFKELGKDGEKVAEGAEGALSKTHEFPLWDTVLHNLDPRNWFSKDKEGLQKLATEAGVEAVGENGLYKKVVDNGSGDKLYIRNGNHFSELKAKEVKAPDVKLKNTVLPKLTKKEKLEVKAILDSTEGASLDDIKKIKESALAAVEHTPEEKAKVERFYKIAERKAQRAEQFNAA